MNWRGMKFHCAAALLLGVLCAQAPATAQQQEPVLPAAELVGSAETLLVLPFENAGSDPKFAWIGEGLAELFIERLTGAGRLAFTRAEWQGVTEKLGLPATARFSRATMLKVAAEADADYVVFGTYYTDGRELRITTRVLRVFQPALSPEMVDTGALTSLMEMQASAGWRVLRYLDPQLVVSRDQYARSFRPLRLDAFENYVRGLLASNDRRRQYLREAARLEPDWADPAFALGSAYFADRNLEAALIWFSRVAPMHRHGIEASFYAGVCHLLRKDPVRAEAALGGIQQIAARLGAREAKLPEVLNNLAIAESLQGKWVEAVDHWRRAQQIDPEEPDYWFNFGIGGLRAGDYPAAADAFRQLLARKPDDTEARALLVAALERGGRASDATTERAACPGQDCVSGAPATLRAALARPSRSSAASAADQALSQLMRVKTALDTTALRHLVAGPPARAIGLQFLPSQPATVYHSY